MKNYENLNRYNYREEEKKKKKAKNLLWLLLLLLFISISIITVIIVGVTNSWFAFTQKMEGDISFENGIVMTYRDIQVEKGKSFYLAKSDGTALNETSISWSSEFDIVNPKVSAASGSTSFVLRAKLDLNFTKEIDEQIENLNLQELTTVLNEELNTSYTETEIVALIFDEMLEFGNGFIAGNNGWLYYTGNKTAWTNLASSPNLSDMYVFSSGSTEIPLLKNTNGQTNAKIKVIDGEGHDMETFYVKTCKITITLSACEVNESAFQSWLLG